MFGEVLKELRIQDGLSQRELAEQMGISKSAISMYEGNNREPNFETLEAFADYFNVSMDYLLGRTDDPTNYDDDDLIASISPSLLAGCNGDVKKAIDVQKAVDEDALSEPRPYSYTTDDDIKFALFNGSEGVTDEMYEEVKQFAELIKIREEQKKKEKK